MRFIALCAISALVAGHASADPKEVLYGEVATWVLPRPTSTAGATPSGALLRIDYKDTQIRLGPDGDEIYDAYRVKILKPEALSAGNVSLTWSPDAGTATVHFVHIIRGSQVIDVLKSNTFQILQREGSLESAILNGQLTASLQVPGLQVGDDLEIAATIRRKDPTLGDRSFGFVQMPTSTLAGAYRIRILWPKGRKMTWRTTTDVPKLKTTISNGQEELSYVIRDPTSSVLADGAPVRLNVRRLVEYSDFRTWPEVSQRLWPLFETAAKLDPDSPIQKEIARIAAQSPDPAMRMAAALQLVEDRIRYVYIGLNGANLKPATADETWERRFGDCKAKAALLLAILRGLGIRSEAVLVNSGGGDGINEHLPTPGVFDHVIVRASIGDQSYWLDGTRLGDRSLELLPFPKFRWALPLRASMGDLEKVTTDPPKSPNLIEAIDLDATAGFDAKASVTIQLILRGDPALTLHSAIAAMATADADREEKAYWKKTESWVEPETVSWQYDEKRATMLLTMSGKGKLDWTDNQTEGHSLDIPGAGFTPPEKYHRPAEQDQTAPWTQAFPSYRCWATTIHLPTAGAGWKWEYYSDPVSTQLGGTYYWRAADLSDGVMRTVMSIKSLVPEITATEAQEVNRRLPKFNNNVSRVYEYLAVAEGYHLGAHAPPFRSDTDWTSPGTPCDYSVKSTPIPTRKFP